MTLRIRTSTLFAGALSLISLSACNGSTSELPPVHLNPNMDYQQRVDAQEHSEIFADGRGMRAPVEGTVARGKLKDNDHLYRGRGTDGRLVDALPKGIKLDEALLQRGQERYDIYCAPCHDESGAGKGMVTKRGGGLSVPPPSYHQDKLRAMPLGYFYDVIANGKGTMFSYAAQIPVEDRWAIAAWVRTLQVHGEAKGWNDDPAAQDGAKK